MDELNLYRNNLKSRNIQMAIRTFLLLLRAVLAMCRFIFEAARPTMRRSHTYELNIDRNRRLFHRFIYDNNRNCYKLTCMNRDSFVKLCKMLSERGGVALLKQPEPVGEDTTDLRWKWFQGCLGGVDGILIPLQVSESDRVRYRNRKGETVMNVMCACTWDKCFSYVLAGWEGSATDICVLRDAVTRRNALVVNRGMYYLVDVGYTNYEGFLAPYRGQKYNLKEWRHGRQPKTAEEAFNMRHASVRNVIEYSFQLLKARWACLRNPSPYLVKMTTFIVFACTLLHNYLMGEMSDDLLEAQSLDILDLGEDEKVGNVQPERITRVGSSEAWSTFRNDLATPMFDEFKHRTLLC